MSNIVMRAIGITLLLGLVALVVTPHKPASPAPRNTIAMATAETQAEANPWSSTPPPRSDTRAPSGPKVIARDSSGQFHLDGFINGRQTRFLVDTGADLVAIPASRAAELGLEVRESDFRPMLQTASGTADGARVIIDRLDVAGASLTRVNGVVVRGLDVMLLGQSALKRLGAVTLRGNSMVIQPD